MTWRLQRRAPGDAWDDRFVLARLPYWSLPLPFTAWGHGARPSIPLRRNFMRSLGSNTANRAAVSSGNGDTLWHALRKYWWQAI